MKKIGTSRIFAGGKLVRKQLNSPFDAQIHSHTHLDWSSWSPSQRAAGSGQRRIPLPTALLLATACCLHLCITRSDVGKMKNTHTHTHKITTKSFLQWNNKKTGKRENKSLTVTDDEYRNRKKISNTHTSTSGIEREKTHKKATRKIARTQQKKKFGRRKVVRNGTDREVRTARRHTYDCLAGWLAAWLSPSSRQFFLRQRLTDWATCATWPTDDWAERIYSFFLRLFCSLFKRAYEWWWNKLTALVVVVVVCSFGLVDNVLLPITNYQ